MQQTKIAAETTSRYNVVPAWVMTSPMIVPGDVASPFASSAMFGAAIKTPQRKIAPITNAPITDARTAFGASARGFLVSSASVDAVSNP